MWNLWKIDHKKKALLDKTKRIRITRAMDDVYDLRLFEIKLHIENSIHIYRKVYVLYFLKSIDQ